MKRIISIIAIIIIIITVTSILGACDGNGALPDGYYKKIDSGIDTIGRGLLGGFDFTVRDDVINFDYGTVKVDYKYKIKDSIITLTAQAGTFSYTFEKKDSSYFFDGR